MVYGVDDLVRHSVHTDRDRLVDSDSFHYSDRDQFVHRHFSYSVIANSSDRRYFNPDLDYFCRHRYVDQFYSGYHNKVLVFGYFRRSETDCSFYDYSSSIWDYSVVDYRSDLGRDFEEFVGIKSSFGMDSVPFLGRNQPMSEIRNISDHVGKISQCFFVLSLSFFRGKNPPKN